MSAGRRRSFGAGMTLGVPARAVVALAPFRSVVVVIRIPTFVAAVTG